MVKYLKQYFCNTFEGQKLFGGMSLRMNMRREKMIWAVLVSAIVSGTVTAIVAYRKGYKSGYKKGGWASIDLC